MAEDTNKAASLHGGLRPQGSAEQQISREDRIFRQASANEDQADSSRFNVNSTQKIPVWCWFTDEVIQEIIENLYQNFLPG